MCIIITLFYIEIIFAQSLALLPASDCVSHLWGLGLTTLPVVEGFVIIYMFGLYYWLSFWIIIPTVWEEGGACFLAATCFSVYFPEWIRSRCNSSDAMKQDPLSDRETWQYRNIFFHGKKEHEEDQTLWSFSKPAVCKILCTVAWKINT